MTTYYVGPSAAGDEDGSSWANRYGSLNDAEDTPVAAGDVVYVGPGVYREQLTCDVSGGNTYTTGTVTVTNGSTTVEGSGTAWAANVAAGYMFHVRYFDQDTDGDTNADNTFTVAGDGNFQASMVGMPIQINTLGAYTIASVVDDDNITLADPNGLGWPADDDGLTYSVMSGEGHYAVASVTDNDTLVLAQPWQGPTVADCAYITFNPITYIADVTGEHTDGVGGVVRITGSDNDTTSARSTGIYPNGIDYRIFRGFHVDGCSSYGLRIRNSDHFIFEDVALSSNVTGIFIEDASLATTIRRAWFICNPTGMNTDDQTTDTGLVIENCNLVANGGYGLRLDDIGGNTIRNVSIYGSEYALRIAAAPVTGQCTWIVNSIFAGNDTALAAQASGQIIEDYNCFGQNGLNRNNVGTGSNSVAYLTLLVMPLLHSGEDQLSGFKIPWLFGDLSEWSGVAAIAGFGGDERNTDMYGIARPATAAKCSWGAVQFHDAERETTTTRNASTASIALHDAGVHHMWVPVDGSEITVSVYCYREANYAGTNPQMVIKQPGQSDRTTTDAAAASQWNQLTDTFTPSATPPYVVVELQSSNTAAAGDYDCFFDDLTVT